MDLPFVDEHRVLVAAPVGEVWRALIERVESRLSGPKLLVRVLRAEPAHASDPPFGPGSTLRGFAVDEVVPERLIRLTGRHRFSRYELLFTLSQRADGVLLAARTHAAFPGVPGFLYHNLVIGSGAHRIVTRRLLEGVSRRAVSGP